MKGGKTTPASDEGKGDLPAAQYVRMSTEHQRYSTENQREAIDAYAKAHAMAIVRTYADEGKSGLNLEGRDGLKQLLADVESGRADFKAILVYDISRWGRFQDADESAYYEYRCRRAGIRVVYCAEPFDNDGSPMSTMFKGMKRSMAAEYSRELSNKVFKGQCHLIELGYRQGGVAGFGLRRVLLDERRQPKGELRRGEHKSLQTDRVILVPGPREEVETVARIFAWFVEEGCPERTIAERLNAASIRTDLDRAWTRGTVHQLLTNEKYVGHNVFNRTSFKLKMHHVRNPSDMWVRKDNAFEGLVEPALFAKAQAIIAQRCERLDDEALLEQLRQLVARTGMLSGLLIDEQEDMPSSSLYGARFGGLLRAYALVGYTPERDYRYLEINRQLRRQRPGIVDEIVTGLERAGGQVTRDETTDLLTVCEEFTVSVVLARCLRTPAGAYRWRLRFDTALAPDITVVVRMTADPSERLDYYLFPRIDLPQMALRLAEEGNWLLDCYRFVSLEALYALAVRIPLDLAA